ncbi:hypothetical protein PMAC_001101 [Pneumocystis sp. 'macacae']|nr:hypothetical protein PMAC_001101 [Pneumocystis sp. 'macacae']
MKKLNAGNYCCTGNSSSEVATETAFHLATATSITTATRGRKERLVLGLCPHNCSKFGDYSNTRREYMESRVESSITKLLLATKQLLEVLNAWSHGTAEEHDVSDVYVRLGNEFNHASAAFLGERIDISDLASIPEDLRLILENTLAEEASPEALERYLPKIRAIIINLLQGLKRKQAEYRSRGERTYTTPYKQRFGSTLAFAPHTSSPSTESTLQNGTPSRSSVSDAPLSGSVDGASTSSHNVSSFLTAQAAEKNTPYDPISSSPFSSPQQAVPTPIVSSSDFSSPYPLSSANDSATSTRQWPKGHAFASFQRSETIDRGVNKRCPSYISRHSMDHTSPLQNISQMSRDKKSFTIDALGKNIENSVLSQDGQSSLTRNNIFLFFFIKKYLHDLAYNNLSGKNASTHNSQILSETELSQNSMQQGQKEATLTLFLQLGSQIKKVTHHKNITLDNLRILFAEKFQFNSDNDSFPPFYIQDAQTKILYELEDTRDITDHSLISLKIQIEDPSKKILEEELSSLTREFQSLKTSIEGQKEMISEMTSRPSTCLSKSTIESLSKQETTILKIQKNYPHIIKNIREELETLRNIYTEFTLSMKTSMLDIETKAKKVKDVTIKKLGGSRDFIELGKKKLEIETQSLVMRIENLSDLVGNLRIDVINRKIKPSFQQFDNVRKEEAQIQKDMVSLTNHLENLSPCWRQLWEAELQNVVEEQEFLTHQEGFIEDLKSDINAAMDVFTNIVTYCEYKEKGIPRSSHSITTQDSTNSSNTQHSDIQNIKSNENISSSSIEKEGRQKEISFTFHIDKFKNELNEFVTNVKFKKIGCMDDIERFREEKNNTNLKEIYFFIKHSKNILDLNQDKTNENNLIAKAVKSESLDNNELEEISTKLSEMSLPDKDSSVLTSQISD